MLKYARMVHNYSAQLNTQPTTVSVVGARGYSGIELAQLLLKHPSVKLTHCYATQDFKLTDYIFDAKALSVQCLADSQLMKNLTDVVFLATPAEVSMKLAPQILDAGKKVIDLSGAFRLKKNDMNKWYGFMQTAPQYAAEAEYGLVPFCGPAKTSTRLIANPGCYATAISLALIPLLKNNLIDSDNLSIDAKSGTTGAGKKAAENLLFSEVDNDCLPYRVGRHQHLPEIMEAVEAASGKSIDPHFVTHLLPTKRGIEVAIFAKTSSTLEEIENAFHKEYKSYPLVRHGREVSKYARLTGVVNSPYTHISYELVGNKLYVFSVIDNLLKGAASQAVENLNRMLDLPASFCLHQQEG